MKLQHFIDRPILSMVISVVILVAGLIGLYALSVEQYPDIAPPTIRVSTTYSGANAEAVQKSVIVPLEEAINGVENMTYMTSTASNTGSAEITVYFKQGSDPDMAAVNDSYEASGGISSAKMNQGTGVEGIFVTPNGAKAIYTIEGRKVKAMTPGQIYIMRDENGKTTKVLAR